MGIILFVSHDILESLTAKPPSDADWHLFLGRAVRDCLRRGIPLPSIAESAQTSVEDCLISLKFSEGHAGLKLEALVDDWTWEEIVAAMWSRHFDESSRNRSSDAVYQQC